MPRGPMSESTPSTTVAKSPSSTVLRLLSALTIFLSVGDLVWFIGTFPSYFRWFSQGWMSPAIPLFLLWTFIGIPSLICAVITIRVARAAGRLGRLTKVAFHLILAVSTLVPLLASFAGWTAGTGGFPWLVWLVTVTLSAALWYVSLRLQVRPGT